MTVRELIALLSRQDPDAEVLLEQPTHDYWRTSVTVRPQRVDDDWVGWCGYHESLQRLTEDEARAVEDNLTADCDDGAVSRDDAETVSRRTPRKAVIIS